MAMTTEAMTAEQAAEWGKTLSFEKVWTAMMETREQMKESDKRFQAMSQETRARQEETARQIKEMAKHMGGLDHSFGDLAEHLVAPGIVEKFNVLGFHFSAITPGGIVILDDQGNELAEIDLLLENGEYSVAVEVKSRPKTDDVDEHTGRLQVLRQYMDRHGDRRAIRGALAGAVFHDTVKKAALKAGLYVIVQTGDTMRIETPEGFSPRDW
ncbi:MAG: hypothetical protein LBT11_04625 [Treponema sp.]|jgi:hypothetical protein|nr:hypothetical protein [Treponema sp.]